MTSIEGAITSTFEPEGCKEGRLTKARPTPRPATLSLEHWVCRRD